MIKSNEFTENIRDFILNKIFWNWMNGTEEITKRDEQFGFIQMKSDNARATRYPSGYNTRELCLCRRYSEERSRIDCTARITFYQNNKPLQYTQHISVFIESASVFFRACASNGTFNSVERKNRSARDLLEWNETMSWKMKLHVHLWFESWKK